MPDRLRPLPLEKLVRIFERDSFTIVRQEGDHPVFNEGGYRTSDRHSSVPCGTRFYYYK